MLSRCSNWLIAAVRVVRQQAVTITGGCICRGPFAGVGLRGSGTLRLAGARIGAKRGALGSSVRAGRAIASIATATARERREVGQSALHVPVLTILPKNPLRRGRPLLTGGPCVAAAQPQRADVRATAPLWRRIVVAVRRPPQLLRLPASTCSISRLNRASASASPLAAQWSLV